MKEVTALVQGGLGNQLFCYAMARAYALKYNRVCALDIKSGYTNDQFERSYRLREFKLLNNIEEGNPLTGIRASVSKFLPLKYRSLVKEKYINNINPLDIDFDANAIYLEGYWQSEKYFKSIKPILAKELVSEIQPSNEDARIFEAIEATNSVFIHIRRINYAHELPLSYYEKAIIEIKKRLTDPVFYVFGDDFSWINNQSIFKDNCQIVSHNDQYHELNDFELMKSCKHAIIANSSFSWWAAWLNESKNQVVVSPEHSGFGLEMAESWLKINNH